MIAAALKAITWATLTTAVLSAVLLASTGGSMPRMASLVGDVMYGRPASAAHKAVGEPSDRSGVHTVRDTTGH
jgi:hypothetical protein